MCDACHIYLTEEFTRGLNFDNKFLGLVGSSVDFDEDIYGLDIEVIFVKKIRDEIKFLSVKELKKQIIIMKFQLLLKTMKKFIRIK